MGNHCGQKAFCGVLMPQNIAIIAKLWDGYKSSNEERDKEVQIYMHLQSLWGKVTPQLICSADIDFCRGIILEDVKVSSIFMLSRLILCRELISLMDE